jgi:hypothetical protein
MSNVNDLITSYLAAWNERDSRRRKELIANTWSIDGSYVDPARTGTGHDGLCAMMATVHERFGPEYKFRLKSTDKAHHEFVRFQWEAGGTADAPMHFVGTDIGIVGEDGRFESVIGFTDEAPAAPLAR